VRRPNEFGTGLLRPSRGAHAQRNICGAQEPVIQNFRDTFNKLCIAPSLMEHTFRAGIKLGLRVNGETQMTKILVASVALATLIASPALAQTTNRQARQPAPAQSFAQPWQAPEQAFAQQPRRAVPQRSVNPYGVYENGELIGADPDPRIRSELLRDPAQHGLGD